MVQHPADMDPADMDPMHMDASAVRLAPMTVTHLDAVLAIERAAAPHPWTEGIFRDELRLSDTRAYFVALDKLVGVVAFAGVLVQMGEAHVTNIAVADAHRRRGIARLLMIRLMQTAIERGALAATLEVRVSNIGAQRLYHRFGFVPAGVRPRYYPDGEDAVIMWADDIADAAYALRLDGLTRHEQRQGSTS